MANNKYVNKLELTSQQPERVQYLQVREGWYYFKRKIPTGAAKEFLPARNQVLKTLETKDYNQALEARAIENAKFEAILVIARSRKPDERRKIELAKVRPEGTTKYLLEAHIPALLDRYRHAILATDDEVRKEATGEDRQQMRRDYEEGLQVLYDDAAAENFEAWTDVV